MAAQGLITVASRLGPKDTMNRLETEVKAKGMTVFARIDHAEGAAVAGLSLPPTEVLIFWQCQSRHPADAFGSDHRDRPAAEGAGLAGYIGRHLAFVQRSGLAGGAARIGRRNGSDSQSHDGGSASRGEGGNDGVMQATSAQAVDGSRGMVRHSTSRDPGLPHRDIWPSNLAAPFPPFDISCSASRPPAA